MTWFFLSLLTALSFAMVNFADKILLLRYAKSVHVAIKILSIFSLLIAVLFIFVRPQNITDLTINIIFPIFAGLLEIMYIYFYLRAIEKEPVAYMIPLFAISPIVVLTASRYFLEESLKMLPIIGIVVIIFGIFILVIAKQGRRKVQWNRYFLFMVFAAVLYGFSGIFFKLSLGSFSLVDSLFWSRTGVFVGGFFLLLVGKSFHMRDIRKESLTFAISEVLYLLSVYLLITSLSKGITLYVYGIINIQPLFVFGASFLLTRYFPNLVPEKFNFKKPYLASVSIIIIIVGSMFTLL